MWPEVIKPDAVYSSIGRILIRMAGIHQRYLAPGVQRRWGYIIPGFPAIVCYMYQTVICTGPYRITVYGRWCYGIYNATLRHFPHRVCAIDAHRSRNIIGGPCQVGADHLPRITAIMCFEHYIACKEQRLVVNRRKDNRCGAQVAIVTRRGYVLRLPRTLVIPGDFPAIYNIGVIRVSHYIAVF